MLGRIQPAHFPSVFGESGDQPLDAGIVRERFAKAQLSAGRPPHTLIVLFEDALKWFEEAEKIRPPGNDDSILRWNRCVRILKSLAVPDRDHEHAHFEPADSPPV